MREALWFSFFHVVGVKERLKFVCLPLNGNNFAENVIEYLYIEM